MKEYTLRELCKECNVTRRAVQWYEKHNLVTACGKTKQSYLLYDNNAIIKVKEIKSLQNYGFTIGEIEKYFKLSRSEQIELLITKADELHKKSYLLSTYIKEIETLIQNHDK